MGPLSHPGEIVRGHLYPGPEISASQRAQHGDAQMRPYGRELFRGEYSDVVPGFYCDKRCWNSIYLDGAVPDEVLKDMCDMSYKLVFEKLPKKVQREILGG